MSQAIACGIDFGTTNSSISIAYSDRVEIVSVGSGEPLPGVMPSVAFLHRNGNRSAGLEAIQQFLVVGPVRTHCDSCDLVLRDRDGAFSECRQFKVGGSCQDSRIIAGLKSELSSLAFSSTHSWAIDFELSDLVAIVLADLKRRAEAAAGSSIDSVVLGYPVAFIGVAGPRFAEMQDKALERLLDAGRRAGFENLELLSEPEAALQGEFLPDGFSIAVDFGGGTFDVAVVKIADGEGSVVSLQGAAVGGEQVDAEIFDQLVAPHVGLNDLDRKGLPIPAWFRLGLRSLGGAKHLMSNRLTLGGIQDIPRKAANLAVSILFGGQAHAFYAAIEQAKIRLTTAGDATIEFHRPSVDLSIPVTRRDIDEIMRPRLLLIEDQVRKAINEAGITSADVTSVVRTGGASQMPGFRDLLNSLFDETIVRERPVFTSVAEGLGRYAQDVWA